MATKHTPGPWRVHSEPTAPYYAKDAEVYAGDVMICGHILARAESDGDGLKVVAGERAANARLIAASPDLLEFVKTALRIHGAAWSKTLLTPNADYITLTEWAQAVIAKAEGK